MDWGFLTEMYVPVILAACLVVGYCIKHISWLDKISNDYIPSIMALLGLLLSIPVTMMGGGELTVQTLVAGAVTGLASTGLHQAFTRIINNNDKTEETK